MIKLQQATLKLTSIFLYHEAADTNALFLKCLTDPTIEALSHFIKNGNFNCQFSVLYGPLRMIIQSDPRLCGLVPAELRPDQHK